MKKICLFVFPSLSESESEVAQWCPTLCDPMNYSLPGSSLHGILQARVLEWVAISFFRGFSRPRDWTRVSRIPGRCFNLFKVTLISLFFPMRELELRRPVQPMPHQQSWWRKSICRGMKEAPWGESKWSVWLLHVMIGSLDLNLEDLIHSLRKKVIKCGTQSWVPSFHRVKSRWET